MTKLLKKHLILFSVLVLFSLTGCSSLKRLSAVPEEKASTAKIMGLDNIRYIVGVDNDELSKEAIASHFKELAWRKSKGETGPLPPVNYLSISGGGDNGAFGAGLLNGWTKSGTRPEFKLVTGVSTGALIAPFAFLGPKYDERIKDFYTNTKPQDISVPRGLLTILMSDSLANNEPLANKLKKEITQQLLNEIAIEYRKGRLLFIGTSNLDSRRGVIWNMTKIAASNHPDALTLFRSIMRASTSIPGAFPPVMIDVEVDKNKHQEMHVDGGVVAQVFIYPPSLKLNTLSDEYNIQRERNLYVLRNSRLDPDWANTDRRLMSIAERAVSSLINSQGIGDLYRIYLTTMRDNMSYNLAYIPPTFDKVHLEQFDTEYMRALFKVAYDLSVDGYQWQTAPPGHTNTEIMKHPINTELMKHQKN